MFGSEDGSCGLFALLMALFLRLPVMPWLVRMRRLSVSWLASMVLKEAKKILDDIKNTVTEKKEKRAYLRCALYLRRCDAFCIPAGYPMPCSIMLLDEAMGFDNPMV